jgi:Ca2+-binding RTX toxin-like protein
MTKIRLIGAALGVAMAAMSIEARADTQLVDPFGDAASDAFIGSDAWGQWLGWRNSSTGDCSWVQLGDTTGLSDDYDIRGLGGDDYMTVLTSTAWFCGFSITSPSYNGHYVFLNGGDGNDTLWSSGTTFTWLFGIDGDDWIYSGRGDGVLLGGSGANRMWANTSGSGGVQYGGDDDDCIWVNFMSSPAATDCGGGADLWSGPGSKPPTCETVDTHCCGLC